MWRIWYRKPKVKRGILMIEQSSSIIAITDIEDEEPNDIEDV